MNKAPRYQNLVDNQNHESSKIQCETSTIMEVQTDAIQIIQTNNQIKNQVEAHKEVKDFLESIKLEKY